MILLLITLLYDLLSNFGGDGRRGREKLNAFFM